MMLGERKDDLNVYLKVPLDPNGANPNVGHIPSVATDSTTPKTSNSTNYMSFYQRMMHIDASSLMRYLRYINVILATLQAFAGFLGVFDLAVLDITSFFISIYVIIFALLLLAFECRFSSMEPGIRRQFGFLFTYRGRTAFIFLVGFMDFGMEGTLAFVVGVLMCINAAINLLILLCHPEFRNGTLTSDMDPTIRYSNAHAEASQFLSQNPEYAAKVGQFAYEQARQNPQYAAQVLAASTSTPNSGSYVPPAPVQV